MASMDMVTIQQKIVGEILNEYKDKEHVIGVCVFGSVAAGKEKADSDVDVTVIFDDEREWELLKENRHGIPVDLEIVTKSDWEMMLRDYPYLFYMENYKVLLDKTGFVESALKISREYFDKNPGVCEFWKGEYGLMRKQKDSGEKPKNFIAVCDEAEIKFSGHHFVRRNILTPEFFHKNVE